VSLVKLSRTTGWVCGSSQQAFDSLETGTTLAMLKLVIGQSDKVFGELEDCVVS
jgi:hypothetical protein